MSELHSAISVSRGLIGYGKRHANGDLILMSDNNDK
jgi:hypothetical protein